MSPQPTVDDALDWLRANADPAIVEAMGTRYGIHTKQALGVPMNKIKQLGKELGVDHGLAAALWSTGWYEARILASMVDDPEAVTSEQMDAWVEEFDNWAIVDTVCFNLFDRTSHAWDKVHQWAGREEEFVKRTAFALLWSLAAHDADAADAQFLHGLELIERESTDGRPLVGKAIAMALRAVGKRRRSLRPVTLELAQRLAASSDPAARRIGRPAARELSRSDQSS